jgi:hypothetical protein
MTEHRMPIHPKTLLFGLISLACGVGVAGAPARAGIFLIDPTGSHGVGQQVGGLDFGVGNTLFEQGITKLRAFGSGGGPQTISVLYQATLAGLINPGGTTVVPPGLNRSGGFEITAVAQMNFDVRSVSFSRPGDSTSDITTATFAISPSQPGSFFRLYAGAFNANNLAGTGFDDGHLILDSKPNFTTNGAATFTTRLDRTTGTAMTTSFDNFGANDYLGMQSLIRTGSLVVTSQIDFLDDDYFRSPSSVLKTINFNTTLVSPYNETNPSQQFLGHHPSIGSVDGRTGPDFEMQSDANLAVVPEPSSMVLAGLGAAGLLLASSRRRAKAQGGPRNPCAS